MARKTCPTPLGVGGRQRLAVCGANDGRCPSRQTCRFALRNMFNLSFYPHQKKHLQKASAFSVMIALRQVISDEMLRIVMIGFAKFKKQRQSYLNICASKSITREALITLNLPPSGARHVQPVLLPVPNKVVLIPI